MPPSTYTMPDGVWYPAGKSNGKQRWRFRAGVERRRRCTCEACTRWRAFQDRAWADLERDMKDPEWLTGPVRTLIMGQHRLELAIIGAPEQPRVRIGPPDC